MKRIDELEVKAIDSAIEGRWEDAIQLNREIISEDPEHLNAHLRLGYAKLQLNELTQAQDAFKTALVIQPKNNIAEEHLSKIAVLKEKNKKRLVSSTKYDPELFVEIPGRTRTIHLVNLGQKEDLAGINIGEEVLLNEKRRKLEIRTSADDYLGSLPDDISKRLSYFINEGSTYKTHIKEIDLNNVVVFIRETLKGKKVRQYPSFPSNPHVMLSDINQIDQEGEEVEGEHKEEEEESEDEGVDPDLEIDDDEWDDFEEEKDLGTIVQLEDGEEEEEE